MAKDYFESLGLDKNSSGADMSNRELIDLMYALESLPECISKAEFLAAYKKIGPCKPVREEVGTKIRHYSMRGCEGTEYIGIYAVYLENEKGERVFIKKGSNYATQLK